ncbi:unnamed protein product [Schistosoma mattheei]|uniref:Uncharacterized protein n=1 Tax=Schistosoma mattheei TaxID=31246 RepID=A0A183P294_9TREM|nr:unnamed protein product [Schistosoma mattheei]
MSSVEISENVHRRRATVNLSRSLGCHRSTYNRRWNKMRAALMKKYDFLSFSEFANESTVKGCTEVNLCSQKFVNRKELMNDFMMYIMSNTSLSIRDADRVLYGLRFLITDIPKSIRGVLKTCASVQPKFIGSGVYYHLGLKTNLLRCVELWLCTIDFDSLNLYINIDGLSISRSSNQQLWPILGRIIAPRFSGVFMIGIYGGNSKPAEFNEFSADTISETKETTDVGLFSVKFNKCIAIRLAAVIYDAPARSSVRYTVNHNSKAGCDRCTVLGRRLEGKTTFPIGVYTLRTDDTFHRQTQSIHHQGHSIMGTLSINMIITFPLDPMHMVYLGVTKKLVNLWIDLAPRRLQNFNSCAIREINNLISGCVTSTPSDFPRKCRTLDFVSAWKASECTLFPLYLGPVILEKTLPQPFYLNFRRLALSMYLLAHPKLHNTVVETARIDLLSFLNEYEWCYGSENLVYNVHSLQHLPNDVRAHGPLDSFSAFPFESYMRHSGFAVAKQAAQRYTDKMSLCDRLQITGLTNTTPIGANHVPNKQVIMFKIVK